METKRWLARGGSLLILIGFFLPSVLVSCSVTGFSSSGSGISQAYSLADLANDRTIGQGLLYLVPLLMIATIVLSFFHLITHPQNNYLLWGQVACLAASLVFTVIAAINLNNQVSNVYGLGGQYSGQMRNFFQVNPDYGALFILVGYILAGVGLAGQFSTSVQGNRSLDWSQSPVQSSPTYAPPTNPPPNLDDLRAAARPRLELISGEMPQVFMLEGDNLPIGRGSECVIQLTHPSVSREHARLRFAQGSWFIQDQDSTAGIVINGEPKNAARLNPGDQIRLGEVVLIFNS
jgi:hypothetical protein